MYNLFRTAMGAAALLSGMPLAATEIEIVNPSFEAQVFGDGQENVNDVTGWTATGTFYHVSNPQDDRFDGTTEGSALPNPIHGFNILGLNTGTTLHQDLQTVVAARGSYQLTLLVGHRRGIPFGDSTVSLMAGGVVLAEAVAVAPDDGKFTTFHLNYEAPESGVIIGQTLRIQIKSEGVDAQSWYDDVRLTLTFPPPPNGNIAIANHSFEEPTLTDGDYSNNEMPGWTASGTSWHVANPNNGWFTGTSSGETGANPIDGANIGGINTGATIHQDLAAVLQPGMTYSLNMLVGQRIGVPFGAPRVTLMAGGEVLAEAVPDAPAEGSFATFQLSYDSPPAGGPVGRPLRIQISGSGSDAQVWVDNLSLSLAPTAPPPPPPGPLIEIANPSFEEPVLPDGQYNENNTPGWVGTGTFHVANPADDWFGNTSDGSSINPIDGANIGGVNTGGTIYQDLTAVLQAGKTYSLSMLVGQRINVPFGSPIITLMAGSRVLAEGLPVAPTSGAFAEFRMDYNSPQEGDVLGQPLRIQISSSGGAAQVWVDNLSLSLTATPPPPLEPEIAIVNSSFEEPVLPDGQFNFNNTPGWVGEGPQFHVANPQNDWFPGTSSDSTENPIDGSNIGGINVGTTLYQDLTNVVKTGVTYKLTMLVGQRNGAPFGTPTVSLLAGGVVLSEATPPTPDVGTFAPFELTYNSPESGDEIGQTIRIQLQSAGADAQAWFDDIKLTAGPTLPPPPPPSPDLAIANSSFENPVLGDGLYTINNTPGWAGSGTWWHVANPGNDWFAGTSAGGPGPNPIDGANAAGLNTGATIHQELVDTVQAGAGYKLTMLVGHRSGVPFGRPTVSLMAGDQVLAEDVPRPPGDGTFAPFELTWNSPDAGGVVGQKLTIRISSSGRDAQAWFDNLKLTIGPKLPPPPNNTAPLAKAVISPLFTVWPDQTNLMVIAVNGESADVVFDATQSSDADAGDTLSYYWTVDDDGSPFANTVVATNSLQVGATLITLLVFDGRSENSEKLQVEVIDLTEALDEVYGAIIESELLRKDKRPLLATLAGATDAFDAGLLRVGAAKLRAFQQKVRAQASAQFPELAQRLIDAARQIITAVQEYRPNREDPPKRD